MGAERTKSVENDVPAAKRRAADLARSGTGHRARSTARAGLVLSLQQTAGNRAVRRLLGRSPKRGPAKSLESIFGRAASQAVVQRDPGDGKEVLEDLTSPDWMPHGAKTPAGKIPPGKKAITGAELKLLMKGAVESAWKTYAYHATRSANAGNIAATGLDPRRGGTGAAEGSAPLEEHSQGQVHYTRKFGLAHDYKRYLEGDPRVFQGRQVKTPAEAEILQVAIHKDIRTREEVDPDSRKGDYAYRTGARIPPENIRRLAPVPIPAKPDSRKKAKSAPLVPGANARAWAEHVIRGQAEDHALRSNMPGYAIDILYDMMKRGLDVTTVLQMIRQGLRSLSVDAVLEMTDANLELSPRLRSNRMDPTGRDLPFKA